MRPPENAPLTRKRPWTSRSVGSVLQHNIFYLLIRLGGRRAAYALLYPVVWYYMLFRPSQRKKTRHYLDRRFPGRGSLGGLLDSFRLSLALGKALVDRATVGILGPGALKVSLRGREELLRLREGGGGLVVMTAHVGCWQAGMSALGFLESPVNMLMHREEGDVDRQYYEHAGVPCPYRIIDPGGYLGGTLEMMAALKRGEVLCVMGDRLYGSLKGSTAADFLGAEARFPYSAFKIAAATGSPVAVLFSYKTGPNAYELVLARTIIVPQNTGTSEEDFRPYVARFVEALEEFTRQHPYQFFNFYDMWGKGTDLLLINAQ